MPASPQLVHFVAPVRVVAAAAGAGDGTDALPSRTIEGLAIEYGVPARASDGVSYTFRPGSLQPRAERTPFLLGHDRQRPAGVLVELRDTPSGPVAVLAVDATPDGDQALVQAASGSRSGLSVGAEPITFSLLDDGTVDVEHAELAELSLVTIPAWSGAQVTRVAATAHEEGHAMPEGHDPAPQPQPDPQPQPTPPAPPAPVTGTPASGELVLARAGDTRGIVIGAERAPRVTADQFVGALVRAQRGDADAQRVLQAAALVPSFVVDNPGAIPPNITNDLLGELPDERPLVATCLTRPMPPSGMIISKPTWETLPDGGWMASDQVPAPTNTPTIGLHDAAIRQWAYAFATSVAVAERSSPDFVESVYRNAIIDYHRDVEAELAAMILAAAPVVASQSIGAGFAAVYAASHRVANLLLMSADVFGAVIDAQGEQRFSTGSATLAGGINGNIYGLNVVVSGALPPETCIVGVSRVIDFRETSPIRLSAVVVGAMQVELGVTSFAFMDIDTPNAFARVDPTTIEAPPLAARSRGELGSGEGSRSGSRSGSRERNA